MIVSTHLESVITYFLKKAFGNFLSENIFLIYVGNLKKQSISISEKNLNYPTTKFHAQFCFQHEIINEILFTNLMLFMTILTFFSAW